MKRRHGVMSTFGIGSQACQVTQPDHGADVDVRDDACHAPAAVAMRAMQVPLVERGDDSLQPSWCGVGVVDGLCRGAHQPRVNGSRVFPESSTQTAFSSRYSSMAWAPFSRPIPELLYPPKGTLGATAR